MKRRNFTLWIVILLIATAGSIYKFNEQQRSWENSISQSVGAGLNRYAEVLALLARSQSVHDWSIHSFVDVESLFNQVVLRESALTGVYLVDSAGHTIARNTHSSEGLYLNDIDRIAPVPLGNAAKQVHVFGKFGDLWIVRVGESSLQLYKDVFLQDKRLGAIVARVELLPLASQVFSGIKSPFLSFSVDFPVLQNGADSLLEISHGLKYRLASQVWMRGLGAAILTVLVSIFIFFMVVLVVSTLLLKPLRSLLRSIRNVSIGDYKKIDLSSHYGPMKWLLQLYNQQIDSIAEASNLRLEMEAAQRSSLLAKQVSHDIRSPLSVLKMLVPGMSAGSDAEKKLVEQAIGRVEEVANDLLKREPSRKQFIADNAPNAFSGVLDEIIEEKKFEFSGKSVPLTIRKHISDGLYTGVDPASIKRVISNLLNNSAEAMHPKGGAIVVRAFKEGEKVFIRIEDNGCGIPPEVLSRLGEEGFSYGKSKTQSGSGLGLHHARTFVEQVAGKLWVESELGKGTQVTLEIPSLGL